MEASKCINDIQKLNGRVMTLSRFISCSVKRYLPFFKTLKDKKKFIQGEEYMKAFENLFFFISPPLLSSPIKGEVLFFYLSIMQKTVSSVLIQEDKGEQNLVYYASQDLNGAELNYLSLSREVGFCSLDVCHKIASLFQVSHHRGKDKLSLTKSTSQARAIKAVVHLGDDAIGVRHQVYPQKYGESLGYSQFYYKNDSTLRELRTVGRRMKGLGKWSLLSWGF